MILIFFISGVLPIVLERMIEACEKLIRFRDVEYSVYENSDEKQAATADLVIENAFLIFSPPLFPIFGGDYFFNWDKKHLTRI